MIMVLGRCSSSPCFVASLNITPEDVIATSVDRSQRSGSASSALRIGLPNASPTMAIMFTLSRSIVSSISPMSRLRTPG